MAQTVSLELRTSKPKAASPQTYMEGLGFRAQGFEFRAGGPGFRFRNQVACEAQESFGLIGFGFI